MNAEPDGRERLAATFDEVPQQYARARPRYPKALFRELERLVRLGPDSRVLEIGPGTGQATRDLASRGCQIVAVERGVELAAEATARLSGFANVKLVRAMFEQWPPPSTPFDLVFAATSFSWIDPAVRVKKAAAILHRGGFLATIATHHIAGGSDDFFVAAQDCYEGWDPATEKDLRLPRAEMVPPDPETLDPELFAPPTFHRYERDIGYSTSEYLELLNTYSGHIALSEERRAGLLRCLADLIEATHEGEIEKRYLFELRLARRL